MVRYMKILKRTSSNRRSRVKAPGVARLRYLALLAPLLLGMSGQAWAAPKLYFTESGPNLYNLQRANTDGTGLEVIVPDDGVNNVHEDMFVDAATNTLYFVDDRVDANPGIYKVDLSGTFPATPTLVVGHAKIQSVAFDELNGHIYYTTANTDTVDYALYRANLDGSGQTTLIPDDGVWSPFDLWLDEAGGTLYIANRAGTTGIVKISLSALPTTTASLETVLATANQVESIYGYGGKIYYNDLTDYVVKRVNYDGSGDEVVIADDTTWQPEALYVDDTTGTLYLADTAADNIRKVSVSSLPSATAGAAALTQVLAKQAYAILVYSDNTAPAIAINNATLGYTENSAAVQIDTAATLSDADGDAEWDGGTLAVQITANNEAADEISIPDNVVGTINTSGTSLLNGATTIGTLSASEGTVTNGTTLTVTFNANATNSLVQQLLRAISYRNTSDAPGASNRTVTVTATDKNGGSVSDSRSIAITAVNDAPVLNPAFTPMLSTVVENISSADNTGTTVADMVVDGSVTDVDGTGVEAVAIIGVDNTSGAWQYSTDGGTNWSGFSASSGEVDLTAAALLLGSGDLVRFTPQADWSGMATLTFVAWDLSAGSSGASVDASSRGGTTALSSASDSASILVDRDIDGDGIPDSEDTDRDGDGIPDTGDSDVDGDGMPNDWEQANGLDPYNPDDAGIDTDGDGVSNLDEYQQGSDPTVDDQSPQVTPPADITVDAVGLLTDVALGEASATDTLDGPIATVTNDAPARFAPGRHVVTWSATDSDGNVGTAEQQVVVRPLVYFTMDRQVAEGGSATLRVLLNGSAAAYPVSVPYTVTGTADSSDHSLSDGTVTINSGVEGTVNFDLYADAVADDGEQIVVEMGSTVNAVPGIKTVQRFTIVEGNLAPSISLTAEQGGRPGHIVVTGGGDVIVTATVTDANSGDSHSFDWSGSDNALSDTDGAEDTFTFDPQGLAPGFYSLTTSVDDGSADDTASLTLEVVAAAPVLDGAADSDGDGSDDASDGYGDLDGDGVVDYLDAIDNLDNVLQTVGGQVDGFLMETEAGLQLALGEVALQTGQASALVSMEDVLDYAGAQADTEVSYQAGLYDFVVDALPVPGQSARIVIPQQSPVPGVAEYRKYIAGLWQPFSVDANNAVASAPGELGYCPPPGDAAYSEGLTAGHWCIQLTIEDGGPNDADGVANGRIVDPGGVAVSNDSNVWSGLSWGGSGGGGATNLWQLLALGSLLWLVRRRQRT